MTPDDPNNEGDDSDRLDLAGDAEARPYNDGTEATVGLRNVGDIDIDTPALIRVTEPGSDRLVRGFEWDFKDTDWQADGESKFGRADMESGETVERKVRVGRDDFDIEVHAADEAPVFRAEVRGNEVTSLSHDYIEDILGRVERVEAEARRATDEAAATGTEAREASVKAGNAEVRARNAEREGKRSADFTGLGVGGTAAATGAAMATEGGEPLVGGVLLAGGALLTIARLLQRRG